VNRDALIDFLKFDHWFLIGSLLYNVSFSGGRNDMIRCVISDVGKVIIFFDNRIFFRKIAEFCSYSAEEIAEKVHLHFDLIRSFDSGSLSPEEFYNRVVKILNADIELEDFFVIYNDIFSLNLPVLNTLKRLKPKYRLLLFSNTDVMRFRFIKKRFPEILIFDDYVLSYEVGFIKPHPEIYKHTLRKARAKPEECLFIDDREENIEVARMLGIQTIHFTPQTELEDELKAKGVSIFHE
jgi:putative hydrolase of the HAD superfamily